MRAEENGDLIFSRINKRLNVNDQNLLIAFVGGTGTGKSSSALRVAERIDPTFTIDRVVFTAVDFIKLIQTGDLRQGNVIIWDESGAGQGSLASRSFMTTTNKSINFFLQGFRSMNLCLIFTLPSLSMLDSQTRILIHIIFRTMRIDRQNNRVCCKIYETKHNPVMINSGFRQKNTWLQRPVNNRGNIIDPFWIPKPDIKLWHQYQGKKHEWLVKLANDVQASLQPQTSNHFERKTEQLDYDAIIKKTQEAIGDKRITIEQIRLYNPELSLREATRVRLTYENKKKTMTQTP